MAGQLLSVRCGRLQAGQIDPADRFEQRTRRARARRNDMIYVGIGGWTYEPWRGVFYPEKL
ncbi:MAG TPA: hypothetical protein VJS85_05650, partial [Rhizomicrobium sp.]|nr:hypothetical protein [Rhizomicrobium sp.]